ncbi:hypothetical protein Bca4012_088846 [Brassica carinata]|uniref:Uncharacterized protein n=3 Tax=Brassica TaxID=3705 RepID=A0ABQ7BA04_BRACR|nr:hypothetical protein DY000_02039398 [Brassica cretica]KAF3602381.1 hypothetical protein F2Q69_00034840 [Brassica cretica]KAG2247921.1 hypothetical protein Bca52824_087549 [Brassica carinata]
MFIRRETTIVAPPSFLPLYHLLRLYCLGSEKRRIASHRRHESSQSTGEPCRDRRRYGHNTNLLHYCHHRSTAVMSLPMLVTTEPPLIHVHPGAVNHTSYEVSP